MSLYRCEKCNCIENTAMAGYWYRGDKPALCSECDPEFGKWHNRFLKRQYKKGDDVLNPPKENKIREILIKVHDGDYDNDDNRLCGHCLEKIEKEIREHFKVKEIELKGIIETTPDEDLAKVITDFVNKEI